MEESLVSVANFILDPNIYNHIRLKNSPEKKKVDCKMIYG